MASLGYKLSYITLISPNQTCPSPLRPYKTADTYTHISLLFPFLHLLGLSLCSPSTILRLRRPHAAVPAAGSKDEGVPRRSPSFLTADLPLPFKHNFGPHFPQPSHHFPSPIHLYSSILSFKIEWVVQFLVVLSRSAGPNNSWLRFCLVFRRVWAANDGG